MKSLNSIRFFNVAISCFSEKSLRSIDMASKKERMDYSFDYGSRTR